MTTSPIKMDTTQAISSVLPPLPSQEELRQLCFNNQHRFITNRSRFSRPDRHPPKVNSIRQDLNPRSGPNLRQPRSDLNCSRRRALLQQVQVPRQQVQVSGPVLQIPPPQQWIWVHNRNVTEPPQHSSSNEAGRQKAYPSTSSSRAPSPI